MLNRSAQILEKIKSDEAGEIYYISNLFYQLYIFLDDFIEYL